MIFAQRIFWIIGLLTTLLLTACANSASAPTPTLSQDATHGMDHGSSTSTAPYDAAFIDGMIMHHEGAIAMAKQGLQQAEHPEIKVLAEAVIAAQQAEIAQLTQWRTAWYPDLAKTEGLQMDMGPMEVPAGDTPFDQRFIQAMIPHHEGALSMARDALQKAEHPEIKSLATAIVTAQEAEIGQMRQWLKAWYNIQ